MQALTGLLVVSVEQAVAAPLCTARLAEAGARVIKIERPEGDFARGYDTAAKGDSAYFVWANQNKESVVLDYKQPADNALLHTLIAKADVFVQNLSPGTLQRAGFGSADLRARHPRLITCDISGYGETSAATDMKAYDFLVQAESGLVSVSGGPTELGRIGVSVCDIGAGLSAHAGILEALLYRSVSSVGTGVKVSLFDVAADWMTVPFLQSEYGQGAPARQGLQHCSIAPYGAYQTADKALTILSIQNEREWQRLCETVLFLPELVNDPRFYSNTQRVQNRADMDQKLNAVFITLTASELRMRLLDASIAFGALNDVAGLARHKALRLRHTMTSTGQQVALPALPVQFTHMTNPKVHAVPGLGDATDRVWAEFEAQK
ncbi:CaiB/BaiF CoA transferase family protein [Kordiimonas pumila]|uniref:CaiB/BaiF CoA transferase family protein n=1 Tax=Kordiimonas pumila TaxID=2161677 RepID=A0ABV7D3T3_9PROT|nr:CaiB/BaiF CoA-transferase family protein [Kordiimonas pumila]